ncbi:S-adenosyl-L-methionine-dependent methyltransferase [Hypoxylon sp. NC0597]|nr:S-adenosyl-L-methionine-dependent methyltransferase [Hypoxylon sp. NC0597]
MSHSFISCQGDIANMGIDHEGLLNRQPPPISDQGTIISHDASDSESDRPLLEQSPSCLDQQLVLSIEEDDVKDLGESPFSIYEDQSQRPITDSWGQPTRNNARSEICLNKSEASPSDDPDTTLDIQIPDVCRERPIVVELPRSTLTQPRSLFDGFIPPAPQAREPDAIARLLDAVKARQPPQDEQEDQEDYVEFDLEEFSIYTNTRLYPNELKPLQHLALRQNANIFYFDGIARSGETRFYLRKIPFQQLPIGNYGSKEHTVRAQIWIRSKFNERTNNEVYYKLGTPSIEYRRFYEAFLWIADLTKHVIDYCDYLKEKGRRAVLNDFESRFSSWLLKTHTKSAVFKKWHSANRNSDFRGALIANIDFIWKEALGLDPTITSWHTIWKEVKTMDRYKPMQGLSQVLFCTDGKYTRGNPSIPRKDGEVSLTIVTPYIYDLFSHMIFQKLLRQVKPSKIIREKRSAFVRASQPIEQRSSFTTKRDDRDRDAFIASIRVGDVISTKPDDEKTGTQWKQQKSKHYEGEHLWFGLVQKSHCSLRGKRSFDVIWLYQPVDTPCGIMKYPYKNELFLSNNCTCHHGTARVEAAEVLSTHNVEWFGDPSTSAEFFVRQTYLSDDCRWTTLRKQHLTCAEDKFHEVPSYKVGDTVLVETNPKGLQLEIFIVEGFFDESEKSYVTLRKLARRKDVDEDAPKSPPNEVVYTEQVYEISSGRIFRHCLVRAFSLNETIPTPYDRNGTGDAFFMTHQEIKAENGKMAYVPLDMDLVRQLRQGFNPTRMNQSPKLQGLDLFCGSGNFGRGLEDGGGVEMRWANDIWSEAIHTYMANRKPDTCTPFLGSVDDLLLRAMQGDSDDVPRPGDVHFISAGSPCPGFSMLTPDKTTNHQRKNQSLVTCFASYIDLYRPHYGILENVPQMVNSKNFRDACVFSQLVCALVGLAYQVQIMFLDAWSFGTPQTRSRVFLVFSAPGFRMPKVPSPSHSHPLNTNMVGLGEMSCGRAFDARIRVSTPFRFVNTSDTIGDLPGIQDAKPDYCVGYPDHRVSIGITPPVRKQLFRIPTQPWGMSFSKAWFGRPGLPPVLSKSDREIYPAVAQRVVRSSKGWTRVNPKRLFNTISTKCGPSDARVGAINHYSEHRPLSILEVRRTQGFPDHELLLGSKSNQWHMVGNSVARPVALALGLAVREAWFGTLFDEPHLPQTGLAKTEVDSVSENKSTSSFGRIAISHNIEEMKQVTISVATDADSSGSETPPEDSFSIPTPQQSFSITPATSESNEFSDYDNSRKRPLKLYVEILNKRQRLNAENGEK